MTPRQVLCIAYFFPPAGGAGVQRSLKFVKYLPQFGWEPRVLSVASGCFFAEDDTLMAEIPPGTEVVRPTSLEIERLSWLRRQRAQHNTPGALRTRGLQGRLMRHLHQARRHVIPDAQLGWLPFAVRAAVRMHRQRPLQALWSTSSPATGHLIAMVVQALTGLPWIADFRDNWSEDPMGMLAHHWAHAWLEAEVLRRAQKVVAVTTGTRAFLQARRVTRRNKFHVIPNGFDPADFPATPPPPPPPSPWRLTFTGAVYGKISTVPFLQALARFVATTPEARGSLQVTWIGQMDRQAQSDYDAWVQRLGLAWASQRQGYVPHAASIAALHAAHMLILPMYSGPQAAQVMPGKIFEYMAAGRPILAMVDRGVAADLIRESHTGVVVHPHDVPGITHALRTAWHQHRQQGMPYAPDPEVVNRFARPHLTHQLAKLLDACVAEGGP